MAEKKGQLPTYPRKAIGPTLGSTVITTTLIKVIQTIEAFIRSTDWPKKARDI